MSNPFQYQDSNQEKVIHSNWKVGNVYRHLLEGSGDIFREFTKTYSDPSYINEKIKRIEDYLTKPIHPNDSFNFAYENNKDKFYKLKQQWKNQPTNNEKQKIAIKLNFALLNYDIPKIKYLINKIKNILLEQNYLTVSGDKFMFNIKKIAKEIIATGRQGDVEFLIIGDNIITMTLKFYRSVSGLSTDQIPKIQSDFLKTFEKIKLLIQSNFKKSKFSNEGNYVLMGVYQHKDISFRKMVDVQVDIDIQRVFYPTMESELEKLGFEVSIY